jgi:hypothetical protein
MNDPKFQEYERLRDNMSGYPHLEDLIRTLREMNVRKLDIDPNIKKDIKKFHEVIDHHFSYRIIEGYPYPVTIVKEEDKKKKLWRKITNEYFEVKDVKDFNSVKEDLYEPLNEVHTAIVRFALNNMEEQYVKKSVKEIESTCNEAFPNSSKYIYMTKTELYCVFIDLKVAHTEKFTDYVTARVYDKYYNLKLSSSKTIDDIHTQKINISIKKEELERQGKNRMTHPAEFEPLNLQLIKIEEVHNNTGIYWSLEDLDRGKNVFRVLTPFSKSVERVICGKEFMTHYGGF